MNKTSFDAINRKMEMADEKNWEKIKKKLSRLNPRTEELHEVLNKIISSDYSSAVSIWNNYKQVPDVSDFFLSHANVDRDYEESFEVEENVYGFKMWVESYEDQLTIKRLALSSTPFGLLAFLAKKAYGMHVPQKVRVCAKELISFWWKEGLKSLTILLLHDTEYAEV